MTLDEFKDIYIGKKPDYDGAYGAQCVDLIKAYAVEVIGSPPLTGDAHTLIRNEYPDFYEYYPNTPFYIPPRGSIAIWDTHVGDGKGHASIVEWAKLMSFCSIDLNWPTGSAVQEVTHTYKWIAGFLVPKSREANERYNQLVNDLRELINKYPKI